MGWTAWTATNADDWYRPRTRSAGRPGPRVVLVGAPSPLRLAVARRLQGTAVPVACLDTPDRFAPALPASVAGAGRLSGATIVLVTVPRPPGLAVRLRHRFRARALAAGFGQAVTAGREHDAARVVVLSTAFRYHDDGGLPLDPGWPVLEAAETAPAAAAEHAARLFTSLGGDSVVLRVGWPCGPREAITRQVVSAARRGWRLIDGDPAAWIAMIAESDAARAVLPALSVAPGIYNLTDGIPVTQGTLNARLEAARGEHLHTLDDPRWGYGALFGHSRKITDRTFSDLTGWRPRHIPATATLVGMLRHQHPRKQEPRC